MNGVIYARYSSDNQREESIEGQLRECMAFAEKNDIQIVETYIDRALSAKTDNRPGFQRMIRDSAKEQFEVIIVWKLDRFARNRYDSAHYKAILRRNNVRVVSATEAISQGPEGIILESLLEGMAEYYSAELAEKVLRGMNENAYKCKFNGGTIPYGYYVDDEQHLQIEPATAAIVREVFELYDSGMTMKEIVTTLNDKGLRNRRGNPFKISVVSKMLTNRRYIGEYKFREIVIENGIPAIIPKEMFESVNNKLNANRKKPARKKSGEEYILTTKLYCGNCKSFMVGESGTSRWDKTYRYYKCVSAKRKSGCDKKAVQKDLIEDLVIDQIQKIIRDDSAINLIADKIIKTQGEEDNGIQLLRRQLAEAETSIENLMKAIEMGIITETTKNRLIKLEGRKKELEVRLASETIKKPILTREQIIFWLQRFRTFDPKNPKHRKNMIDSFVNAIVLYDDKIIFYFNYKENAETLYQKDLEDFSDLFVSAPPYQDHTVDTMSAVWLFSFLSRFYKLSL